jgi:co-chaperonin GroES (HSP10)
LAHDRQCLAVGTVIEEPPPDEQSIPQHQNTNMANKVKPLADRVLVEAAAAEETTKGGIIIPDTAKEKPQRGKVIAVGTGRVADDGKVTPLTVKVGDEHPVRQVQRHRAQPRRQGLHDHARKRHLRSA